MPLSLRRPKLALGLGLAGLLVLGVVGLNVEGKLKPTSLQVSGTESAEAGATLQRYFGDSAPFAILLRGPAPSLNRQGPDLIRALRRDPAVTTISPWDRGHVGRLRPAAGRALILVDFHVGIEQAVDQVVPSLEKTLENEVEPPVTATQTGFASLSRAIQDESIDATERGELIALPVLLIVLLLVFRSPIAALVPLAFGALTVFSARGVLSVATSWLSIDGFALTVATMMGLALGVDYALLMVSRFREELAAGGGPQSAALTTRRTAGRTILFAGSTLFLAMAVSVPILPGALLVSLAGTVIIVVALSVVVATVLAPPLLALVGRNVNRWRIGAPSRDRSRLMSMAAGCLRRPLASTLIIGGLVLLLALPILGLRTGPPSPEQLPTESQARKDAEQIDAVAGPGWEAPFVLVASTKRRTITDQTRLAELAGLQDEIASDPGVQLVIGPRQVARRVAPLRQSANDLVAEEGRLDQLAKLGPRLARAQKAVGQFRTELAAAAAGAGLLGAGSGHAEEGASAIAGGLQRAVGAGERAIEAVDELADGTEALARGQGEAKAGALAIKLGLRHLLRDLRPNGLGRARQLRSRLSSLASSDPAISAALEEAKELVQQLSVNRNEVRLLRGEAERLHAGEGKLLAGSVALQEGTEKLSAAAADMPVGIERLQAGATRLAAGLESLSGGASELERRLSEGFHDAYPLEAGLGRASVKVTTGTAAMQDQAQALRRRSPAMFDSGYFVLSTLDGAPAGDRARAAATISVDRGGQAAAVLVIPRHTFNTDGSIALYRRLEAKATDFAAATGIQMGVTGGAAQLTDYASVTRAAIPMVVIAITLATLVIMVIVLRALPIAVIAVALNLATVGVAFGILTLLFNVPPGYPLGGHSYVDAIGATAIFGVVFGLSIDYAVFLLTRMRERFAEGATGEQVITFGLEKTARVITGAAAIMMAVFIAFAGAPIATISQLGVGLTVAVLLDATIVRIVLLPALMLLLGDRVWWLPRPLRRVLPEIDLHGDSVAAHSAWPR